VDFQVVRCCGVESEMELPYAGLHQLCSALLVRLDQLPGPQRHALQAALGLAAPTAAHDRFLVGLAVLSLVAMKSDEHRCSAWSMTRNGWTTRPCRRWRSWLGD
jgi:hypothetical protein